LKEQAARRPFEMSAIFPKWTNWLPLALGVGAALAGGGMIAGVTCYFTPQYVRVGSAWAYKGGNGFNIQLEPVPLGGARVQLVEDDE
jgi:hypothetical protein